MYGPAIRPLFRPPLGAYFCVFCEAAVEPRRLTLLIVQPLLLHQADDQTFAKCAGNSLQRVQRLARRSNTCRRWPSSGSTHSSLIWIFNDFGKFILSDAMLSQMIDDFVIPVREK